jgi:hypothetical protein
MPIGLSFAWSNVAPHTRIATAAKTAMIRQFIKASMKTRTLAGPYKSDFSVGVAAERGL